MDELNTSTSLSKGATGRQIRMPNDAAIKHALAALDAASLGECCIGEIMHYIAALRDLSDPAYVEGKHLSQRMDVIHGLAKMTYRYAEEMESLMNTTKDQRKDELRALEGGAQ
ncbi:hypothetical protein ACFQUU_08950 [Herbaspirillum sp. GCM10030257]|uniref:hypothetical protein n=1 Tax=Herbaspirillum sp. GCM10030257 TaxID=3273393 RepID=UPI00360A0948